MSILINESYANPTTPLWASSTGGGGGSDNGPMRAYILDAGFEIEVPANTTFQLATFPIPAEFNAEDNFLFNVSLGISNIAYGDTVAPNNVSISITFSSDNAYGTVEYASYTEILLTNGITSSLRSINGLLANAGTNRSLMTITLLNQLTETINFNYSFNNCWFQKVSAGDIVVP
jgi:hypothetical protein